MPLAETFGEASDRKKQTEKIGTYSNVWQVGDIKQESWEDKCFKLMN